MSRAEVTQLAIDLRLDVQRLLAAGHAAGVAGLHERADLLPQLGIGGRR